MKISRVQLAIVVLVASITGYQAEDPLPAENEGLQVQNEESYLELQDYRLPTVIKPISYDISLIPDLEKTFTFSGNVIITAIVQDDTKFITLHAGKIDIGYDHVLAGENTVVNIAKRSYNNETEKYQIETVETLKAKTTIKISFSYTGVLSDSMTGFYRSSYVDDSGHLKWLAATQFQTTSARHAFPCFDEPMFKATFVIKILRKETHTCLSNMPLKEQRKVEPDLFWDMFEQSIPMSTYLVAFMVSDFDNLKNGDFRVWARPNAIEQAQYSLDLGTRTLKHLSTLFDSKYQLPKMDMAALPDFAAGAMENWGLVNYRETRMLYDERVSSIDAKQSVAAVIVHELSHMWFGNAVTPMWWSYLWLSEAFARYFQYFGTAKVEPTWNMEYQFVVDQHQSAFAVDGLESSQPMTRNVTNRSHLDGIGDSITYNKGGSIVRMMNLIFDSTVFDQALRNYLKENNNGNVYPKQLFHQLQEQVNRSGNKLAASVEEIMTTWTVQSGYPVLLVSINNGVATVSQRRFLLRNLHSTSTNVTWWIPITWASESNPDFANINVKHWMKGEYDSFTVDATSGWIVFNVQSSGFYRVVYDNATWDRIFKVLNSKDYKKIHVLNRAAIVDDLLNLARGGYMLYERSFEGLRYLEHEDNYVPIKSALNALEYHKRRFAGDEENNALFAKFILKLFGNTYKKLGYTDRTSDDHLTIRLRSELNKWACHYNHEGCVTTFTKMFQEFKKSNMDSFSIPPNQRPVAYCMGIKHGTADDWEFLYSQYYSSNVASEQVVILEALGCSKDPNILEMYMLKALEPFEMSRIRRQDSRSVFTAIHDPDVILDFVDKHHAELVKYDEGHGGISGILNTASQRFSTQRLLEKFGKLIDKHHKDFESIVPSLQSYLDVARYELRWYNVTADRITSWMKSYLDNDDTPVISTERSDITYSTPADDETSSTEGTITIPDDGKSSSTDSTITSPDDVEPSSTGSTITSPDDVEPSSTGSTITSPDDGVPSSTGSTITTPDDGVPSSTGSTVTSPDDVEPSSTGSTITSPDDVEPSSTGSTITSPDDVEPSSTGSTITSPDDVEPSSTGSTITSPDDVEPSSTGSTITSPDDVEPSSTGSTITSPDDVEPSSTGSTITSPDDGEGSSTGSTITSPDDGEGSSTESTITSPDDSSAYTTISPITSPDDGATSSTEPTSTTEPEIDTSNTTDYRLPQNIAPFSYDILLTPDLHSGKFTFDGEIRIGATVVKSTNQIVFHGAEIQIKSYSVHAGDRYMTLNSLEVERNDGNVKTIGLEYQQKYDFWIIKLADDLLDGQEIFIDIEYTGSLNEEMRGFYRSSYLDSTGQRRWLAASHLEPTGARKMFPCFDEPAFKANFTIHAVAPKGYNAISNMPIAEITELGDGRHIYHFKETPVMSTYLVALIVSDFKARISRDLFYSVWARPNAVDQTEYSLSVMDPLVKFYEKSLKLKYQLPKLDMAALPDFSSGAMENWGLLTYKEKNMLYDPKHSSLAEKQVIINVISHEISHQWFGNLVSPLWWKYLWLNEGFARYFQFFGTANVETDWSLESQFVVEQLHSAFSADSSSSSHPMTHDVYSPTEIRAIFDSISYAKGASVLRMVDKILGRDVFYSALNKHLVKRSYDVATPEDLFNAFQGEISDPELKNSIHDIMNTWTTQAGFPVVHVSIKKNTANFRQERFLLKSSKKVSTDIVWHVPISWASKENPDFEETKPKYWLKQAEGSTELIENSTDVLIFNVQQTGFYRVNYDNDHWQKIIEFLKSEDFEKIHEINRASLIDDLMNLGRANYVDYDIVLSAMEYLTNETNYIPWRAFFNGLTYLDKQMKGKDVYQPFKRYITTILTPIYESLGFEDKNNDSHTTKLLRSHVRKWACTYEIADCQFKARSYVHLMQDKQIIGIPPNYHSVAYCNAAKEPSLFEELWNMYLTSNVAAEKSTILQSLACTTDKGHLESLLRNATTKTSDIRQQDSSAIVSAIYEASPEGVEYTMQFIKENYDHVKQYYSDISSIKSFVKGLGKRLVTSDLYNKFMDFVAWLEKEEPKLGEDLKSYAKSAISEYSWSTENLPKIHHWLETNYPDDDYRLPTLFTPLKYDVRLAPYFQEKNFTFHGKVQIELQRNASDVSRIVLNADKLDIKKVSVFESTTPYGMDLVKGRELPVIGHVENEKTQKLSIFAQQFVQSEVIIVEIEFEGYLNEDMQGFYRSYYVQDGEIHWLATTQFEATYARQTFPCFDEPAFKATFTIHLERPDHYNALSNMPRESFAPSEVKGRTWDTFKETVKMSTYLLAFVVSDFERVNRNGTVNVWGRPEVVQHGDLAQIAGIRMLDYLYGETGVPYALSKLDLVGIPDFAMGAMENWGLATFREYGLFYHENVTTARHKDYMLTIIAHELAHMWFGNLITCDWWEYIWLNEGFAELMQWRVANLFRPGHGFEDQFVVNELQAAMRSDGLLSTHAMNRAVSSPSEINSIFDTVTYGKSSSVLRMLKHSLEPATFGRAMVIYFSRHRYQTANPDDLWSAFDQAIKHTKDKSLPKNITTSELMDAWINKPGYPIVHATLNSDTLTLTQERFVYTGERNVSHDFWVPITVTTRSTRDFIKTWTDQWLESKPLYIKLEDPSEWYLVNVRQTGYYRVNYDKNSWWRLIHGLISNHTEIHATNRAQIVDDLLNLARVDYVDYNVTLTGATYLTDETNYLPWKAFFAGIDFLVKRFDGQPGSKELFEYISLLTENMFERLDFEDSPLESHFDQLSRELILSWSCKVGNKECIRKARQLYLDWSADNTTHISPNARPAVYCTAVKYDGELTWNNLWNAYKKTLFSSEKSVILDALGCTRNVDLLNGYLDKIFTPNYTSDIRKEDFSKALSSVYDKDEFAVNVMLDYLIMHVDKVRDYYGNWKSVGGLFSSVASSFSTTEQIEKLKTFINNNKKKLDEIQESLNTAVTKAEKNYEWYKAHSQNISEWLISTTYIIKSKNAGGNIIEHSLSITFITMITMILYLVN